MSNKENNDNMNNPVDIILATAKGELRNLEMDDNYLIKISVANSNVIERLISNDPNYPFRQTKEYFLNMWQQRNGQLTEEDCFDIVKKIVKENSTRTADEYTKLFAHYMFSTDFFERLANNDIKLVDDMLDNVIASCKAQRIKIRKDKSLASKICKYLNEWLYDANVYSINDSFVRDVLPYYLMIHGVDRKLWIKRNGNKIKNIDKMKYVEFIGLISKLEEKIAVLDKNKIDHILWYGYRSDPIRCEIAKALAR